MQTFNYWTYCCSSVLLFCLCYASLTRNPFHILLCMVNIVLSMAVLLVYVNAEFLGPAIIMVYLGIVVVLFVFTVIFVNYKLCLEIKTPISEQWPIICIFVVIFIFEVSRTILRYSNEVKDNLVFWCNPSFSEIRKIGYLLFNTYSKELLLLSIIVIVAIIGMSALNVAEVRKES